jgi:hypothetical protein
MVKNMAVLNPPPTSTPQVNARERRRYQRVKVTLLGRYMLEDRREFPCQTLDMSPGGVALFAPERPKLGERVVAYIDELGRIEGVCVRLLPNGFALTLTMPRAKREKLADQLTWFANRSVLGLPEDRRHERIVPRNPRTVLRLPDGTEHPVKIIDISVSGTAVQTTLKPKVGTIITVGNTQGRIVRVAAESIAIEFLRLLPIDRFDENLIL